MTFVAMKTNTLKVLPFLPEIERLLLLHDHNSLDQCLANRNITLNYHHEKMTIALNLQNTSPDEDKELTIGVIRHSSLGPVPATLGAKKGQSK